MEWEALAALEGIDHDPGMGTEGPEGGSESAANGDLDEWSAIFLYAGRSVPLRRYACTLNAVALRRWQTNRLQCAAINDVFATVRARPGRSSGLTWRSP